MNNERLAAELHPLPKQPLYLVLSRLLSRWNQLSKTEFGAPNAKVKLRQRDEVKQEILRLVNHYLPAGGGFDCGTRIDWDLCFKAGQKHDEPVMLAFTTEFHHMNAHGSYDGWTSHSVYVRPTFGGIRVDVTGRNRNQIKDLIWEKFNSYLIMDVQPKTLHELHGLPSPIIQEEN